MLIQRSPNILVEACSLVADPIYLFSKSIMLDFENSDANCQIEIAMDGI